MCENSNLEIRNCRLSLSDDNFTAAFHILHVHHFTI